MAYASVPRIHSVTAHERALISSSCLHPATVSRRSDTVDGLRQVRSSMRSSAHDANKWRHSAILDTVAGWRSGARRLARPSAERIRRTTGPDDRLCHRRAAIGRAVLGGSSVGARVREDRGARSTFGNANVPTTQVLMQRACSSVPCSGPVARADGPKNKDFCRDPKFIASLAGETPAATAHAL